MRACVSVSVPVCVCLCMHAYVVCICLFVCVHSVCVSVYVNACDVCLLLYLSLQISAYSPPRQAPRASDQTRGFRGTHTESSSPNSTITGIYKRYQMVGRELHTSLTIAVVKGMLSIKDDAMADTQTINNIATSNWFSLSTAYKVGD